MADSAFGAVDIFDTSLVVARNMQLGVVVDDSGEAVIGANILEKGTTNGTISDIDGSYSLTVQNGATLEFSFTGMSTMTEIVNGRTSIDVTMAESSEFLDEVIVSALGFEMKKDETGSTAAVALKSSG